jgi:hypothetical protein
MARYESNAAVAGPAALAASGACGADIVGVIAALLVEHSTVPDPGAVPHALAEAMAAFGFDCGPGEVFMAATMALGFGGDDCPPALWFGNAYEAGVMVRVIYDDMIGVS